MEMDNLFKDQKTMIAIGVGLIIIIAVIAIVFIGGGNKQAAPSGGNESKNETTGGETTKTNETTETIEVKTQKIGDQITASKNAKIKINFEGYTIYVTDCVKNGNLILAKAAYFPTTEYDAILYNTKDNVVYIVKGKEIYKTNAQINGNVDSCKEVKEDIAKGLDLNNAKPIEYLLFA